MKSKDKDQEKHQEELEKNIKEIDSVEHRDILSVLFNEGEEIFK
jgi:translation elongation factor EF-1beta